MTNTNDPIDADFTVVDEGYGRVHAPAIITPPADADEDPEQIYLDADGVPLNDMYHTDGKVITDLKDGIYVSMPEYVYFAQKRLGSSDFKVLGTDEPENFYWGSRMNPDREEAEAQEDLIMGKALHKLLLEGEAEFSRCYDKRPATYPDEKTGKAKKWNMNANYCKDWVAQKERDGVTCLSDKTYRDALIMGRLITRHEQMGPFLASGISELTVLFHYDGIPVRARFDSISPGWIVDLKTRGRHTGVRWSPTYTGPDGEPMRIPKEIWTCLQIIRNLHYDLQQNLYNIARSHMKGMVEAGMLYGASPKQAEYLAEIASTAEWKWVFCFYRKLSHSSKNPAAPMVTPLVFPQNNSSDIRGNNRLVVAVENYNRMIETFGNDRAWARVSPAVEIDDILIDHIYGADDNAPPSEISEDGDGIIWDEDGVVQEGEGQ